MSACVDCVCCVYTVERSVGPALLCVCKSMCLQLFQRPNGVSKAFFCFVCHMRRVRTCPSGQTRCLCAVGHGTHPAPGVQTPHTPQLGCQHTCLPHEMAEHSPQRFSQHSNRGEKRSVLGPQTPFACDSRADTSAGVGVHACKRSVRSVRWRPHTRRGPLGTVFSTETALFSKKNDFWTVCGPYL